MARARVLSFMSTFGGPPRSSTPDKFQAPSNLPPPDGASFGSSATPVAIAPRDSPGPINTGRQRASSRPMSMIGGYQPPLMEIASDTIPELAPIFTFLNSHSNKLYQEGYFLKLNDLDTHGRPYPDRSWTECFAQLVGTVLSLWDAAALDAAGQDGEVAPTFINLADASIKMIETLSTRSQEAQPLANVLSISTAGKNRYLFHFSNVNALTQWTAGIRLAMFENASLQEAYTGSLIAGKGKNLNNIRTIMGPTKFKAEEWTRVRFGAGTPWRRCWCVISPPDEKEVAAHKKQLKKKSAYDRSLPVLKGDIKFYDTRKTKKVQPIATINDAYSAYSIYPQSKPLIDQSTLIKIEGTITIHSKPETTTEGFIFIMPEVRPAISGFEMMLRFLFPIYDVFALYGRPSRLAADTMDTRSLMFAMPQDRRYGYLEIFDIATLIHTSGSQSWSEREWKKRLKQLTAQYLTRMSTGSKGSSRVGSRHGHRNSLPSRSALRFQDNVSMRSTPSLHRDRDPEYVPKPPPHTGSAPPGNGPFEPPRGISRHHRSASESVTPTESPRRRTQTTGYASSRLSHEASRAPDDDAPTPPIHGIPINDQAGHYDQYSHNDRSSSESEHRFMDALEPDDDVSHVQQQLSPSLPPDPVAAPPAFSHEPGAKPHTRPYHSPELRRANSRMSSTTLSQLAAAGNASNAGFAQTSNDVAAAGANAAWGQRPHTKEGREEDQGHRGVNDNNNSRNGMTADSGLTNKVVLDRAANFSGHPQSYRNSSQSPTKYHPTQFTDLQTPPLHHLQATAVGNRRSPSPLSDSTNVFDSRDSGYITNSQALTPSANQTSKAFDGTLNTHVLTQAPNLPSLNTRYSIARKPLPMAVRKAHSPQRGSSPVRSPQYTIDEAAFNRVSTMRSKASTENDTRRYSGDSSHYDADSVASPDSMSTTASNSTLRFPPQYPVRSETRTGVKKTVGDASSHKLTLGDAHYQMSNVQQHSQEWQVDFGPTQAYKPEIHSLSSPAEELSQVGRKPLPGIYGSAQNTRATNLSTSRAPNEFRSTGRLNGPASSSQEVMQSRPPSAEASTESRSVVWQPGAVIGGSGNRRSITPEQFVQQRVTGNRVTPAYAHNRQHSTSPLQGQSGQTSETPPRAPQNSSRDWIGNRDIGSSKLF